MRMLSFKITPSVLILVILGLLVAGCSFFSKGPERYYVSADGPVTLGHGAPVTVDRVHAGEVLEVVRDTSSGSKVVICFELGREYSIPVNSVVRIVNPGEEDPGYLAIDVKASRTYYQEGDTITSSITLGPEKKKTREETRQAKLMYRVQLMASSSKIPLDASYFGGLGNIEEIQADGVYKYYTGPVDDMESAKKLRSNAIQKGIGDAFIVPFLDGRRISIQEAEEYEK